MVPAALCKPGRRPSVGQRSTSPRVLLLPSPRLCVQVNYLSHHFLSLLLLDKLKAAGESRIVNVSSISHSWVPFPGGCCGGCGACCFGGFDLTGGRFPAKAGGCCSYEPFEDYAYSKAAQIIMTGELHRRLLKGTGVIAVSLEPGLSVESGIADNSCCLKCVLNYTPMACVVGAVFGKSLPQMAATVVYAALANGVSGGDFFRNVNKDRVLGPARDPAYGPPLWDLSSKAVSAKISAAALPPQLFAAPHAVPNMMAC